MHKVTDIKRCQEIASACTDAFLHEPGTFPAMLDAQETMALMQAVIHMAVLSGSLYENEAQSAWMFVYHKHNGPSILAQARMGWNVLRHIKPAHTMAMQQALSSWQPATERFRKEQNYLYIYLFAIRTESQHQGMMRAMLRQLQKQAAEEQIPIILDTDSPIKRQKYEACGFRTAASAELSCGICQYAMIWRPY